MIKYTGVAAASKVFSARAGGRRLYRRLGDVALERMRVAHGLPQGHLDRADRLLTLRDRYDVLAPGDRVLELGTGWVHREATPQTELASQRSTSAAFASRGAPPSANVQAHRQPTAGPRGDAGPRRPWASARSGRRWAVAGAQPHATGCATFSAQRSWLIDSGSGRGIARDSDASGWTVRNRDRMVAGRTAAAMIRGAATGGRRS